MNLFSKFGSLCGQTGRYQHILGSPSILKYEKSSDQNKPVRIERTQWPQDAECLGVENQEGRFRWSILGDRMAAWKEH